MPDHTFIAAMRLHLFFPTAYSLKSKRSELSHIKAGIKRFGVSFAEVEHQDSWQRATLAVSLCSESLSHCREQLGSFERYLEKELPQGFQLERKIVSWNDLEVMQ
jgi:uncharacterized protein YlxP (DUF503 family)